MKQGPRIAFHGGKCCGIKIIHTLDYAPEDICQEIKYESRSAAAQNADQYNHDVTSSFNFYNGNAPEETVKDRIKRYIEYLRKVREQGIIEIVLATSLDEEIDQMIHWADIIKEMGFVEVSSGLNSNSGNRIHVFHLVTDLVTDSEA